MGLQTDVTNITAARLKPLLAPLSSDDVNVRTALGLLRDWDGRVTAESGAAALYEVWTVKHLGRTAVAHAASEKVRGLLGNGDLAAVLDYLEADGAARPAILNESLAAAFAEVSGRLGPDPAAWRWGDLHQARFEHVLTPLAGSQKARDDMSAGPAPMGGTMLTPLAASWRPSDYRVIAGASFRMVLDVGAWDNSRAINTPGQSGEPGSKHFRDLFPLWAKGEYVPLLYSRKAVEKAAERRIRLTPR